MYTLSIIKDSVASQFTGTLTLTEVGFSLLTAFVISLFIVFGLLFSCLMTFTLAIILKRRGFIMF